MESLQYLKRRLRGVANINQITKAMELVAATKMRRSQEIALSSRPYAFAALDFLSTLSRLEGLPVPPLLEKRPAKKTAVVVITSDKGLAGSFNSAVLRTFEKYLRNKGINPADPDYRFVAVGQKAASYLEKRVGRKDKAFVRFGDFGTLPQVEPLADFLVSGYLNGDWDRVTVFSTHFKTALRQEVLEREILPVDPQNIKTTLQEIVPQSGRFSEQRESGDLTALSEERRNMEYLIEPSAAEVLEKLAAHLVLMEIYHIVLEANASEHAARRAAMKNASDNAAEFASRLTLLYNKSRQAAITKEITEITAGAEALQ